MRKRIDWDAQPLGKLTDLEIAKRLGVSQVAVFRQRTKRGIPPARTSIKWDYVGLGTQTDIVIARRLGVGNNAVAVQRNKRGIPPANGRKPRNGSRNTTNPAPQEKNSAPLLSGGNAVKQHAPGEESPARNSHGLGGPLGSDPQPTSAKGEP